MPEVTDLAARAERMEKELRQFAHAASLRRLVPHVPVEAADLIRELCEEIHSYRGGLVSLFNHIRSGCDPCVPPEEVEKEVRAHERHAVLEECKAEIATFRDENNELREENERLKAALTFNPLADGLQRFIDDEALSVPDAKRALRIAQSVLTENDKENDRLRAERDALRARVEGMS
jgi:regulator of replication initiation timing